MAYSLPPPSAQDRNVNFVIPKEVDPLYVEWFQAEKKQGESVNDFILRQLSTQLLTYIFDKEVIKIDDASEATKQADITILGTILKDNLT